MANSERPMVKESPHEPCSIRYSLVETQAVLPGPGDGLGPRAEVEFVVDVRDVIFDGVIDVKHFSGHVASCKNVTDGG